MLQEFYSALPISLQHACVTAQGARYYYWRYSGIFQEYLRTLKHTQYLPAPHLHQWQASELAQLRKFAAEHVPYYRQHGTDGFTSKEHVQESPGDFIADIFDRRALIPWHTSGTSGKPLRVYYSREAMQRMWAFVELYRNTAGVTKEDRRGQFTGKMIVPKQQRSGKRILWRRDLANRALLLSTVHLTEENLPHYAAALERFRPVYLSGYPSSMCVLANYYRQAERPAPSVKAALTSAETLLSEQRTAIEQTFSTRVFDQYGQAEMQSFWFECEEGRMHAHPLAGLTEVVRADGTPAPPGELGEVVLTGLVNYAMPLVRYRIGDTARFATESCPCGRGMPVIEEIGGRLDDFVFTRDRGFLGRLDPILKGVRNIVESQLEQESLDLLHVRYVPAAHFTSEDLQQLEGNLRARVGEQIRLEFQCMDRIPRSSNGKFRFVISRIARNVPRSCASSRD